MKLIVFITNVIADWKPRPLPHKFCWCIQWNFTNCLFWFPSCFVSSATIPLFSCVIAAYQLCHLNETQLHSLGVSSSSTDSVVWPLIQLIPISSSVMSKVDETPRTKPTIEQWILYKSTHLPPQKRRKSLMPFLLAAFSASCLVTSLDRCEILHCIAMRFRETACSFLVASGQFLRGSYRTVCYKINVSEWSPWFN